ncbi:hypothetical protein FAM18113_01423 [Lacticaseibacillus paracasei]|nr:hypothetical protein FAM18113_01423 [Lacticaseibacillus paracasei]
MAPLGLEMYLETSEDRKALKVRKVFPEAKMCHTLTFNWARPLVPRKVTCGGMGQRLTTPQHYSITLDQLGWTKVSSRPF